MSPKDFRARAERDWTTRAARASPPLVGLALAELRETPETPPVALITQRS